MRIAITGDRYWSGTEQYTTVLTKLAQLRPSFCILGDARGVDTMAAHACRELGIPFTIHKADWDQYGDAAGPIRNRVMLDDAPDAVVFFHNNLPKSKGTLNCVQQARKRGIEIIDGTQ